MSKTIILGAGPAGLAAGLELAKYGQPVLILEKENKVGGMSRTERLQGHSFDLAPHRFFTKNSEVKDLWHKMLGDDFLEIPRLTRIYYKSKYFYYPLKPLNALKNLGITESLAVIMSFLGVRIKRVFKSKQIASFEEWVINRFGKRLFYYFFKSYTEKLWGISTQELSAEWAAQRIKSLSLSKAVKSAFLRPKHGKIKSLINKFHYPRLGSGMMYKKIAQQIVADGGEIKMSCDVVKVKHDSAGIKSIVIKNNSQKTEISADNFISTLPLNKFIQKMDPPPPTPVLTVAKNLKFRAIVVVTLIIDKANLFPDNWLYMQEPQVKMTRLTNFNNWGPDLVTDKNQTVLSLEYVCWENDELWSMSDEGLISMAKRELSLISMADENEIPSGCVVRILDAYPIYAFDYKNNLKIMFEYLSNFKNLQSIGRSGMFRYNNMDHSILSGLYAARNILGENYDLSEINAEGEYFEEQRG